MNAEEQAAAALANAIASLAKAMDTMLPAGEKRDSDAWLKEQKERYRQAQAAAEARHEQRIREHQRTWRRY